MRRNITIYESAQNGKTTIMENVEVSNVSQLKQLLRQNNISYEGMDFLEGVTGTKLLSDESLIPENIPYQGEIVHDACIILTLKDKKMRHGINTAGFDRHQLLEAARDYKDELLEIFGKNYTNLSSATLAEFLENVDEDEEVEDDDCEESEECESSENHDNSEYLQKAFAAAITVIKNLLAYADYCTDDEDIISSVRELAKEQKKGRYSKSDIERMIAKFDVD